MGLRGHTMRSRFARMIGASLLAVAGVGIFAAVSSAAPASTQTTANGQYIYAAHNDGTVGVYNINNGHQLVKTIRVFSGAADIRGAAAAAPTHRFYVMYDLNHRGYVACVDLDTDKVLWNINESNPMVDRGTVTANGQTLYVPTGEYDTVQHSVMVINAATGAKETTIPVPTSQVHDTALTDDQKYLYIETQSTSADAMYIASTATNTIVKTISGYCCTHRLGPFTFNAADPVYTYNDVYNYYGFQMGDVATGKVAASVPFTGTSDSSPDMHGLAMTPNGRQIWATDDYASNLHVFDNTVYPPKQVRIVPLNNGSHWTTFSIDGRYAYVAGRKNYNQPTEIISTSTYKQVATISASEDIVEVDFSNGAVTAVGDQTGLGHASSGTGGRGGTGGTEIHAVGAGKCLDDPGSSTALGTQQEIWTCNGGANQSWTHNSSNELTATIGGTTLCLDAAGQGTSTGTKVQIWNCNGGTNQQWKVNTNGTVTGVQSGLCLEVAGAGTANGSQVDLATCNGQSNQHWTLG